MFPNDIPAKQRGSALIVAVFIIVVIAALAAGLTKILSASSDQVISEVLGTRAMLAAEAGNERVLAQLFPIDTSASVCLASQQQYFTAVTGLMNCNVRTLCTERTTGGLDYYSVVSTGVCKAALVGGGDASDLTCGSSEVCVSRSIEVEAKAL